MDPTAFAPLLSVATPVVAVIAVIVGLRFSASRAAETDKEHQAAISNLQTDANDLRVKVATLTERTDGMRTHIDNRFDNLERHMAEMFRSLNGKTEEK